MTAIETIAKYSSQAELSSLLSSNKFGIVSVLTYNQNANDGSTDATSDIQEALDAAAGSVLIFPEGVYVISSTLYIKYAHTHVIGLGNVEIKWAGSVGEKMLVVDYVTYNSSDNYENIRIENFYLNGDSKALWGLYTTGLSERCHVENVRVGYCTGFIYADACWYSVWKNIFGWYSIDGIASGGTLAQWQSIYNSFSVAPFAFKQANNCTIEGLHIIRAGVTSIPTGGSRPFHLLYISGNGLNIDTLSFEFTYGNATKTNAVSTLFSIGDSGTNMKIDNIYVEFCYSNRLGYIKNYLYGGCSVSNVFIANSGFAADLIEIDGGESFDLGNVSIIESDLNTTANTLKLINASGEPYQVNITGSMEIHCGEVVDVGGKNYSDPGAQNRRGAYTMNLSMPGNFIPKVSAGLTVTNGSDTTGEYVLIEPGKIINTLGKEVVFGYNGTSPNTARVGWLLRPDTSSANWNVCVDQYGCVFIEKTSATVLTARNGKMILATFTTTDGAISALTAVTNTYNGEYINNHANKRVYVTAMPNANSWVKGDMAINTNVAVAGTAGSQYIIIGWSRLTTGSNNVLDTDWAEMRVLTGT